MCSRASPRARLQKAIDFALRRHYCLFSLQRGSGRAFGFDGGPRFQISKSGQIARGSFANRDFGPLQRSRPRGFPA
jgi:hypothetical protein